MYVNNDQCDSQGWPVDMIICRFLGSGMVSQRYLWPYFQMMLNLPGYLGMQESSKQWFMCSRSWISCRLQRSISLFMAQHCLRHSQPSPPQPVKLWIATLQTRERSIFQLWMRMVSTSTLSPGFLLASQVKLMPEKAEYRPARLGYMETQFSNAWMRISPRTNLTTILSVMTFSMTPKVIGPALMQVSMRKFPLLHMAISAPLQCRQIDTKNSKKGDCSFLMVEKRRSMSFWVQQATLSCLTLNYLYRSSMQ